ncbi:MAG: TIGR03960 family B12-binding radical SAM protein [Desulfobacterales bacterium]|jgi:radical SAM family uncharacterized protein/radical SAM-linked protein
MAFFRFGEPAAGRERTPFGKDDNMYRSQFDNLLSLVERPSRYLGTEVNSIRKDPTGVKLRFALAFPDLYEIGTSHFGIQILYHLLNQHPEIVAERVFAPAVDLEQLLRDAGAPLVSLESRRPLGSFDILGFSLLYELNYTNILTMLNLSGIPFRACQRQHDQPLVIAGGPCASNPEPVAELFDAILIGDGERAVLEMAEAWIDWKASGGTDKALLLRSWAQLEGVYVPAFFKMRYRADGLGAAEPEDGIPSPVRRAVFETLEDGSFPDRPVVPFGRPVHDRLRLEISRGCTRGCRFCQAGMIYRPVRERPAGSILRLAHDAICATGYEDLSLLSLSTGDYSRLSILLSRLMDRCGPERIAVSLPSFRAGSLTPEMMDRIRQVRKTGFTIAPEAGSQRLRDVINKNLGEREIERTVADAFSFGWQVVKLYFMIGLPTETDADHDALVDLVLRLRSLRKKSRRRGQLNVSVTTFIPKAHTPFQWSGQISTERSESILSGLRQRLASSGIQFKWQNPQVSFLEGLWARGDRRLLPLLVLAWEKGCRFDGWTDHFDADRWRRAVEESGIDAAFFVTRSRALTEPLPWDHIDMRVSREYLQSEYQNALMGKTTGDCRWGECRGCGVCDFDRIEPVVLRDGKELEPVGSPAKMGKSGGTGPWVRFHYQKIGDARYFGHLEMASLFARALRRAQVPVAFSSGFHPKPRMIFSDPLPLGLESEKEAFDVLLDGPADLSGIQDRINAATPDGLKVINIRQLPSKTRIETALQARYRVWLAASVFDPERIVALRRTKTMVVSRRSGKGTLKKIDLKDMILSIELLTPDSAQMLLRNEPGRTLRPADVLAHVFQLDASTIRQARILKLDRP